MADEKTCPHCGKPVPPTTLGGICPECMLKAGLATQTEGPGATGPHGTKVIHPPPSLAEIASLFPQLEILECLGRGGMGVVYRARQPRLNRLVALKILARDKEQDAQFAERFTREAQALARLNHPNIVTVYDFGAVGQASSLSPSGTEQAKSETGATPVLHYLLMEFVDGLNLRQLLQTGKMPPEQALTIVPKICEALQYAHEQGIVHRDIKPENILLDKSGRVKIADFGIAKMMGDETGQQTLTGAKEAVGTPHYMAPEQIEKPLTVDHRADIYSLGVVFYEMLTGELPLGKFQPPSKKVQIDVRLDEVVLHALEKEPERRYQQASQVKTAVETISAASPGGPANPNESVQTAAQIEAARKRLKIPARGLIAAAVFQLLFALGLLIFTVPALARENNSLVAYAVIGFTAVGFLIPTAVVLAGAINMLNLRRYTLTVVASAIAAVAGPGAILGLPFGIWACVELFRPEVRAAFATIRPPTGSKATPDSAKMDFARYQVKGPAIGLVVTGVLNWVVFTLFLMVSHLKHAGSMAPAPVVYTPVALLLVCLLAMALSGFIIYGALKIMRLERWSAGIAGGILAMIVAPANIIGLPIGIWALVALNRREVRAAFEANGQRAGKTTLAPGENQEPRPPVQKPDHFWRRFAVTVLTLIILIPAAIAILIIGLPIAAQFVVNRQTQKQAQPANEPIRSDYIGQSWFPQGDSIEITSVERTENQMTVKGHYHLVSHKNASLALYTTTTNDAAMPTASTREMEISKGNGDFALIDPNFVPGMPHVSMYADGKPFASLYFGTQAESLEESKAGWITNAPSASAETWSPTPEPGGKVDLQKILQEAQDLMSQSRYEESLQRLIWYHDHSLSDPAQTGVRNSFALSYWVELGRRYPKAKQALLEIRDHDMQEFADGRGDFDLFMEVSSINHYLGDDDPTYRLFQSLQQQDKALAQQCYELVQGLLVQHGEYDLCLGYLGDPQTAFERIRQSWERMKAWEDQQAATRQQRVEQLEAMAGTNALFANGPVPFLPELPKFASQNFIDQTRQLIEILVGAGQNAEAEKIRDQALVILDDPKLESAVSDAKEKILKRVVPESDSQPAVSGAQKWLALIDAGNYSESWNEASAIFQGAVTEAAWANSMNTFREPLGDLVSRKLKSAQRMTELPGAHDGQYVVMQFETSFADKKSAIETVTFMLGKDGQWKCAGYFIK